MSATETRTLRQFCARAVGNISITSSADLLSCPCSVLVTSYSLSPIAHALAAPIVHALPLLTVLSLPPSSMPALSLPSSSMPPGPIVRAPAALVPLLSLPLLALSCLPLLLLSFPCHLCPCWLCCLCPHCSHHLCPCCSRRAPVVRALSGPVVYVPTGLLSALTLPTCPRHPCPRCHVIHTLRRSKCCIIMQHFDHHSPCRPCCSHLPPSLVSPLQFRKHFPSCSQITCPLPPLCFPSTHLHSHTLNASSMHHPLRHASSAKSSSGPHLACLLSSWIVDLPTDLTLCTAAMTGTSTLRALWLHLTRRGSCLCMRCVSYSCAAPSPHILPAPRSHQRTCMLTLWYGIAFTEPEFCHANQMWASDSNHFHKILYILLNCACNTKLALAIHPQDATAAHCLPSSAWHSHMQTTHCRTQLVHEQLLRMGEFQNVYDIECCYLCIQYAKYTNLLLDLLHENGHLF